MVNTAWQVMESIYFIIQNRPLERSSFNLRLYGFCPYALKIPIDIVKSRLARARLRLSENCVARKIRHYAYPARRKENDGRPYPRNGLALFL